MWSKYVMLVPVLCCGGVFCSAPPFWEVVWPSNGSELVRTEQDRCVGVCPSVLIYLRLRCSGCMSTRVVNVAYSLAM